MFLHTQPKEQTDKYIELLQAFGSLSRLFSENKIPYLYYRAHENIFCKAFDASNESRGDVAVDAVKNNIGIGLKTFIHKNSQYEKIAEFNKLMPSFSGLDGTALAEKISLARNERINVSSRLYELNSSIYHCVSRSNKKFTVYEVKMDTIDINSIKLIGEDSRTVQFHDGISEYKFNRSKSTLFKKFTPSESIEFEIDGILDPYEAILKIGQSEEKITLKSNIDSTIVLPLYSSNGDAKNVSEKSGLNQWNAGGRTRASNEIYIPIPAWIHSVFSDFFPDRDVPFELILPNSKILSVKVCQDGNKALMSNPNADLGQWLLRDVLNLQEGELLTYDKLLEIGIDSVSISKLKNEKFEINFKSIDTFERFQEAHNPKAL